MATTIHNHSTHIHITFHCSVSSPESIIGGQCRRRRGQKHRRLGDGGCNTVPRTKGQRFVKRGQSPPVFTSWGGSLHPPSPATPQEVRASRCPSNSVS